MRSIGELSQLGNEDSLNAGAVLWNEGDPGNEVIFLIDGLMEVVHQSADGEEVVIRTLESGSVVGEMASLDGQTRSATVRAQTPCRVLRIPASEFKRLLTQRPDILEELFWLQVERVRSLTTQVTRVHQKAITDPLTQLYNVGFFRERLFMEVERARQTGDPLSVVIFDVDHFKMYNDNNGHEEGNVVLKGVADIFRHAGRRGDVIARYGGEEFVALLYGATTPEALRYAENVREHIEKMPFNGGDKQPGGRVTVSGGVATFPREAANESELIRVADSHLYDAKRSGRNRIVWTQTPQENGSRSEGVPIA